MKKLIVFAAPSGSGKSTIVKYLLTQIPQLSFSVSATTRTPRKNELHGKDYYYISTNDFKDKISKDAFVEWEEVYPNLFYGTLKEEIEKLWGQNKIVIFDIDVQGAMAIKKIYPKETLTVYVDVPHLEVIQKRLSKRDTETPHELQQRLMKANYESGFKNKFDVVLVNDVLEHTLQKAISIVSNFINKK